MFLDKTTFTSTFDNNVKTMVMVNGKMIQSKFNNVPMAKLARPFSYLNQNNPMDIIYST